MSQRQRYYKLYREAANASLYHTGMTVQSAVQGMVRLTHGPIGETQFLREKDGTSK